MPSSRLALVSLAGLFALALAPRAAIAQDRAPIVPPGAQLEELFTDATFTEGPAVSPRDGSVYFSDIPRGETPGRILRYDPETGETSVFLEDSGKSNGLIFDREGRLVACQGADYGGRAVVRIDTDTRAVEVLTDHFQGRRYNACNDLVIDPDGRIYFTDPRYLGHEPRELDVRAVYRIELDGSVTQIITDIEKPNGIALSPDGRTLYVADHNNGTDRIVEGQESEHGAMTLNAYPISEDGTVGDKRILVDYAPEAGVDGMCVDIEGNIYGAVRCASRFGIGVYSPEGEELAFIDTPDLPTNCEFGRGDDSAVLYITAGTGLYRIRLGIPGYHPETAESH